MDNTAGEKVAAALAENILKTRFEDIDRATARCSRVTELSMSGLSRK